MTTNAYNINRIENIFWLGAKYAVNDRLDLIGALYYIEQNNFLQAPAVCTGTGIHISSASCAGSFDTFSFLLDYRPVKRIDLYAGVALSNIYGGLSNGYLGRPARSDGRLAHQVLIADTPLAGAPRSRTNWGRGRPLAVAFAHFGFASERGSDIVSNI